MSRHLISTLNRVPSSADNNPYQPTTVPHVYHQRGPRSTKKPRSALSTVDTAPSEDTCTDSHSYHDYYFYGQEQSASGGESGSVRFPHHHEDDNRVRIARSSHTAERNHRPRQDARRVYPQQHATEIICNDNPPPVPRRLPPSASALSERPQSSMSSGVHSAIVDGCGGKCQTCENVCYFFLQLVFMMGILIGVSLCIAGLVLRKSAARNLQVLVYIGFMLAVVSTVLLAIQWNARNATKRRKMAVRNTKRAPIPLETLNSRQQQQPLMAMAEAQRVVPQIVRSVPLDQQGIPWWRRNDLV